MTTYLKRNFRRQWLTAILLSMPMLVFAQQPQAKRVKKFSWEGEPVKIIALEVQGEKIDFESDFQTDDDNWLRGLKLSVKNVSDKTVCWINIAVDVNSDNREHGVRDRLLFGSWPAVSTKPDGQQILRPGESVDINFPEKSYEELKVFMKQKNYPSSINEIKVSVDEVGFVGERDVLWIAGYLNRRDPNNPNGWIPVNQK